MAICEQVSVCSPSSTSLLAGFAYNNRGQRTGLDYGNGLSVAYAYDASDRLSSLAHDLTGASDDQSFTFDYNPAGQIVSRAKTNTAYDYDALSNVTIDSVANALNQITCVGDTAPACTGGTSTTHDARGNMTAIGADTYSYDIYNRMTAGGSATLSYDGAGRLYEADDGVDARRFLYDGAHVIAEYDDTGTMLHRYVRGASGDEVLVEYDGSGTSSFDKTWLHHDERGSVIAGSNFLGAKQFINTYDEFGKPDAANEGSFQYTGQLYLAETETAGAGTGLYHYKARAYNPELGRFMQTDPVGYAAGLNLYAYVGGDPVNSRDPSGLLEESDAIDHDIPINPNDRRYDDDEIIVEQERRIRLDVGRSMQFAFEQGLRDLFASNTITFNFGEAADGDTGDGGGDDVKLDCDPAPSAPPSYSDLNFDPNGPGAYEAAFFNYGVIPAISARNLGLDARKIAAQSFPRSTLDGGKGDAFRHAYWSFTMTQRIGNRRALAFGNAYEISSGKRAGFVNEGARQMDLYNNRVGRQLALANPGANAENVIRDALQSGCLKTSEF